MTRRTRRLAFAIYAVALFAATHYPNLRVRVGDIERPDLIIHMLAFGGWCTLLIAAEFFGPWRRYRSLLAAAVVSAIYACFDEFTQGIPFLNRTVGLDDLAANLLGVSLVAAGALCAAAIVNRRDSRHERAKH